MFNTVYDAMVVGAGASGAFAAKELTAQGLKVVLLEAGPEIGPKDFDATNGARQTEINLWQRARATMRGQGVQARAMFFNAGLRHLFVDDRKHPYTTPADAPFLWIRGRQAGGRTHTFGRVLLRWTDDDFKIATRTGRGVDWPIGYEELAPFYDEVERCLGLYGNIDNVPTLPDGAYSHEARLTPAETLFKTEVESKWPERRVVSWRYIGPEPTRVLRPLRQAIESGNLNIRHNAIVRRITTDEVTGRATGAEIIDGRTGEVATIKAASVVLCASPIESVRLLLNSATPRQPGGLANSSGILGRYFMDQLPCIAAGTFPKAKGWSTADATPADPFYRPSGGIFIPRFVGEDGTSAASDFDFQGSVGRAEVADAADARLSFFGFGLMLPREDNRITLDPRRKDAWGIPVPHIRCGIGDADAVTLTRQLAALAETIEGAGGVLDFIGSPLGLEERGRGAYPEADPLSRFVFRRMFGRSMVMGAAIHETGGARMGKTPSCSVLNAFNQSWDVPNLFVTDASAFVGSGVSGTTLTIMALTVRACRYLAGELRGGRI
jgi:choline dehydrogenase-like flavoprotein